MGGVNLRKTFSKECSEILIPMPHCQKQNKKIMNKDCGKYSCLKHRQNCIYKSRSSLARNES